MPKVIFTEIKASDLGSPALTHMVGSERGRLLRFTNAILARAETNKNQDDIDDTGISEIAASLALTALDIEHKPQSVLGFFTDARNVGGTLATDGIVFADRFPQEADDLVAGRTFLSVEADAKQATCSACGSTFVKEADYCDCLRNRRLTGAVRKLKGLSAVGGGITKRPAGTNTKFDRNGIEFIASCADDAQPATKVEATLDEAKLQSAQRAAQRLFANYANDLTNAQPQLNMYRPVFSPLTYTQPNPAFVDEIANRVVKAMQATQAALLASATPIQLTPSTAATAPTTQATTVADVQTIVSQKLEEIEAPQEEAPQETGTANATVTASAKPTSVGLVGLGWDAPNTTKPPLKATW